MQSNKRVTSIDLLRGIVIILMALDHVRDYFHYDAFFYNPYDIEQSNLAVFFTRFVTHFCAPVFVLLAGTSAYLVGIRKGKKFLSSWLVKRGLWLIIAEITIIKFAWFFKMDLSIFVLQVIWILGLSMIFLAAMIHLPKKLCIGLCFLVIFGHNFLDNVSFNSPSMTVFWGFLHQFGPIELGSISVFVAYPVLPWVFVMPLGYWMGSLYNKDFSSIKRKILLSRIGMLSIFLFFALRIIGLYGDSIGWTYNEDLSKSIMSFFSISKYPPSLHYLLITVGPALLFLAHSEGLSGRKWDFLLIFGRVPMFFYIVHLYVIHLVALLAALVTGFNASDMQIDLWINFQTSLQGYGFQLPIVYLVWILIVLAHYPLCRWYYQYKSNNRDKWILDYL